LPEGESQMPQVQIEGWNVASSSIAPTVTIAAR